MMVVTFSGKVGLRLGSNFCKNLDSPKPYTNIALKQRTTDATMTQRLKKSHEDGTRRKK
jgi:hypothetical protein